MMNKNKMSEQKDDVEHKLTTSMKTVNSVQACVISGKYTGHDIACANNTGYVNNGFVKGEDGDRDKCVENRSGKDGNNLVNEDKTNDQTSKRKTENCVGCTHAGENMEYGCCVNSHDNELCNEDVDLSRNNNRTLCKNLTTDKTSNRFCDTQNSINPTSQLPLLSHKSLHADLALNHCSIRTENDNSKSEKSSKPEGVTCHQCGDSRNTANDSGCVTPTLSENNLSPSMCVCSIPESEPPQVNVTANSHICSCELLETNNEQTITNRDNENLMGENSEKSISDYTVKDSDTNYVLTSTHDNETNITNTESYDTQTGEQTDSVTQNNKNVHKSSKKWTKIFTSILARAVHKSDNKNKHDHPSEDRTISDKLPEVRHAGILHTRDHSHCHSVQQKLRFQIHVTGQPGHEHETSHATTVVNGAHNNHHSQDNGHTRISNTFKLPSFSRKKTERAHSPQHPNSTLPMTTSSTSHDSEQGRAANFHPRGPEMVEDGDQDRKCPCCVPLRERMKQWWQGGSSIEGKEIRNTLVVGVAFQLIFTAHFAIQNLQSSLHEEQYLGVSALGCLYATSIFSSIFAPTIIGILGLKGSLVLAWVTHILYTLAQLYPTWQTLVPAAILLGALTGPTWTAQGVYVSACAFSFSKRSPHSPYTILSRFNGLFFTLYETRQILGNLLSSAVLTHGVANKSEEIIFKYCGPRDCPASENVTDIEEPENLVIHAMIAIYMALQVVALVLTIALLTPLARSDWCSKAPVRETAVSWFKTLVGTRMLFLVPFMIFPAMEQGILLSEYTKSYVSCPIGIHMVGFVMATHGATSAVFVFVFSRLARRTGRYPLFAFAAVTSLILLVVLLDWTPQSDQQALIFFFPVLWGIGEGVWQTHTNSMIAVVFYDRKEPAFANYQTWRAVGYTFIFSFHSLLCVDVKIAITIAFLVVGMVLYTGVEIYSYWKEKSKDTDNEDNHQNTSSSTAALAPLSVEHLNANRGFQTSEELDMELSISPPGSGNNSESFTFMFDNDRDLVGEEGQLTLDGTYIARDESAYLDNDLKRYGIVPTAGSRPLTQAPCRHVSDEYDRWATKDNDNGWNSGNIASAIDGSELSTNHRIGRSHTWHEHSFQDEGELRVLRTKDDVFVF